VFLIEISEYGRSEQIIINNPNDKILLSILVLTGKGPCISTWFFWQVGNTAGLVNATGPGIYVYGPACFSGSRHAYLYIEACCPSPRLHAVFGGLDYQRSDIGPKQIVGYMSHFMEDRS